MLSLGETTEAVVVWHLCSLEKLLNMPCSFLDCCPFPGFRILSGIWDRLRPLKPALLAPFTLSITFIVGQ